MIYQLVRFGVVGLTAMAVHFLVVKGLVPRGMTPLTANVLGFFAAFQVSYWGHSLFTFWGHGNSSAESMARFILLATGSFLLNEGLYAVLLRHSRLPYDDALMVVLFAVSAFTFVLSRNWAFQVRCEAS